MGSLPGVLMAAAALVLGGWIVVEVCLRLSDFGFGICGEWSSNLVQILGNVLRRTSILLSLLYVSCAI